MNESDKETILYPYRGKAVLELFEQPLLRLWMYAHFTALLSSREVSFPLHSHARGIVDGATVGPYLNRRQNYDGSG